MIGKRMLSAFLSTAALITAIPFSFAGQNLEASAAVSYPVQKFLMGISNTDRSVNASGTALKSDTANGTNAEEWTLNYVSSGVYEIVSTASGNILTSSGNGVVLAKDTDSAAQRWKIEGVQKDFDGYCTIRLQVMLILQNLLHLIQIQIVSLFHHIQVMVIKNIKSTLKAVKDLPEMLCVMRAKKLVQ